VRQKAEEQAAERRYVVSLVLTALGIERGGPSNRAPLAGVVTDDRSGLRYAYTAWSNSDFLVSKVGLPDSLKTGSTTVGVLSQRLSIPQ